MELELTYDRVQESTQAAVGDRTARCNGHIHVRDMHFYYGAFQALRGITLDFAPGAITAIIGPSGCGKSTLLRTLNRMTDMQPNTRVEGMITLDGSDLYARSVDVVDVRRRIGMVFQRPNPFPKSIYENIAYGLRRKGVARRDLDGHVEQALRKAGLWNEVSNRLQTSGLALSGGQQQRLCIARALAMNPAVLLMDEPCSALDPIATLKIEELMRELRREITIITVTHSMQQAGRVSDTTVFMLMDVNGRAGMVVETGPTNDLFTAPRDQRTEDYISGRFG
ncbi:MAG: phosphate ABC transporter ATP-binding protein PstB [Chloroflexales bacterium]